MKKFVIIVSLFFFISSCNNEENKQQENSLVGTWKLIETYGGDGGSSSKWTKVNDGYTFHFDSNNSIISNKFSCNGIYHINSNDININFNCTNSQFNQTYNYSIENGNIILKPSLLYCDEGCAEKFQKITEE